MAATYPGGIKSWTPRTDNVDDVMADDVNTGYEEITALQTELGVNVAGSATDLVTRLSTCVSGDGHIQMDAATTLTISAGAVTPTGNYHLLDTESAAASDNLDTITGTGEAWLLFLRTTADARDVTIRHGVGNIVNAGAQDIILGTAADLAVGLFDETLNKWVMFGVTQAAALVATTTLTTTITTVTAAATLDATYQTVGVNATDGAVTITLPAAAGCTGRRYDIKKVDSSANAVTIDGNGAETIDGAATKVLSTQYSSVTIISNGTNWWIV